MGKCILLIRVSTERQEYEAQTEELLLFAKSYGYDDDNIILIQDKESGIKLNEEERQGLNKLKEAIYENPTQIDVVFCWELSRLSRQPKILYSIRDFLLDRKINLIVKEPFLKLLDDNKEPISTSLIQFGFFIALVENEMRDKKARFERGKRNKAVQGKYTGGYIRFGYTIDNETKKFVINDDEADVIRLVYNLYETGRFSQQKIVIELKRLGYTRDIANIGKVQNILSAEEYTGQANRSQLKTNLPVIIAKEQFNYCRQISDENNSKLNKSNEMVYYSQLLLYCSCCDKKLHPRKSANLYSCSDRSALTRHTLDTVIEKCEDQNYINLKYIDSFLWRVTTIKEAMFMLKATQQQIDNNNLLIEDYNIKLDAVQVRLGEVKTKRNRLGLSYSDGMIDDSIYNKRKEALGEEEKEIFNDRLFFINELDRLNNSNEEILSNISKITNLTNINKLVNELQQIEYIKTTQLDIITDDNVRYDLIRKHIKKVVVRKMNDSTKALIITYNYNDLFIDEIYYYFKVSKNTKPVFYRLNQPTINVENFPDTIDLFYSQNTTQRIITFPLVRECKVQVKKGQYEKIKAKMEADPQYAERKRKNRYYYSKVWKIKNQSKLTEKEKDERLKQLKEEYKEYI